MAKYVFHHRFEWSDMSEYSPTASGSIPHAVILPDGERVSLDEVDIQVAGWNQEANPELTYIQLHDNVRVQDSCGGDQTTQRHGRRWSKLEVQAPKGSTFAFTVRCPFCGERSGETIRSASESPRVPIEEAHLECQSRRDEEQAIMDAAYAEHE